MCALLLELVNLTIVRFIFYAISDCSFIHSLCCVFASLEKLNQTVIAFVLVCCAVCVSLLERINRTVVVFVFCAVYVCFIEKE